MVSVSSPATMAGLVAARKAHKPLFFLVCCAVAALGKVPGKGVVKILEFVALRCVLRTDVVPTLSFRLLYGLLIMGHDRRHILWLGVTAHPSAEWIANQLTAACGWEQVPHYLIRDRDACYGSIFIRRVRSLGIRDQTHICTLAMAERVCRAADRLDPPGMFGPYRGDRRAAPSPHPPVLHGVLQRGAHAPLIRQGCAQCENHSAPRVYRSATYAWWVAPSVCANLICGRDRSPSLSWVDYIISIRGYDFWKGHGDFLSKTVSTRV
jgi:hypothetical protein